MRRITPKICKNNHGCAVLLRAACDAFNPDPKQLTPSVKLSCICTAELQSTSEAADTHHEAVSGGAFQGSKAGYSIHQYMITFHMEFEEKCTDNETFCSQAIVIDTCR